jgi:hypothetical protein
MALACEYIHDGISRESAAVTVRITHGTGMQEF